MMKNIAKAAMLAVTLCSAAWAQTSAGWKHTHLSRFVEEARYEASGVVIYPRQSYPAKIFDVRPHQMLRQVFPSALVADGNNPQTSDKLWAAMLSSPYTVGGSAQGVRGKDLSSDWGLRFSAPSNPGRLYWSLFYEDNVPASRSVAYATSLQKGPNTGARVVGSGNLIGTGDARTAWVDPDGSLSFYWTLSGLLDYDSKPTTFQGGPAGWDQQPLSSQLSKFIGYEESKLYFLEGKRTLHVFDRDLKHIRTDVIHLSGELRDVALGDIIDGKDPELAYVGWDLGPVIAFLKQK
jgi:hypothetical protein